MIHLTPAERRLNQTMLLAFSSGVAPPLATEELLQSNGSVRHPVAATAVAAARLVRTRASAHGLQRSDRPVKGSVACAFWVYFFLHGNAVTHSAGVNVDVRSIHRDCLRKRAF